MWPFKGCDDGVHRFEARYDKSGARLSEWEGAVTNLRLALIEKTRDVTYVCDVCVRCGKTIERDSNVVPLSKTA